ncbi:hypothetical protein [Bradyrhizobium genosp. A]|uniref:hypothetical protein n=1 Tax=Bradyrhizobium genosp. A TaxID=83626 RepID=UPI003CECDDBE
MDLQSLLLITLAFVGLVIMARVEAASHSGNNARGLKLLSDWLSPEQLKSFKRHSHFDVVGSDSGTVYRIYQGKLMNIVELDHTDRPVYRWCFVPEGSLVAGDVMLSQKIALETDERRALAVANRSQAFRSR